MTTTTIFILSAITLVIALFILNSIEDYFNRHNGNWTTQGKILVSSLYIVLNGIILACLFAVDLNPYMVALASGIRFFQVTDKF